MDVEFPDGNVSYTTLEKPYRTTKDIMKKANEVIDKFYEDQAAELENEEN